MIFDAISAHEAYHSLHPRLARAFGFLTSADLRNMEEGIHEIVGKEIFVNVQERDLKLPQDAPLEVHDKYIDIQVLIAGEEEGYGWKSRAGCGSPRGEMSEEKDVLFYDDKPDTYYTMRPGEFSIFFPQDAHAPMVGSGRVKKCIVKVLI